MERLQICGQSLVNPLNSLLELNRQGVHHLNNGEHIEAIYHFKMALQLLGDKFDPLKIIDTPHTLGASCDDPIRTNILNPSIPKNSYIYQRREYDEGMHFFSHPIQIQGHIFDNMDTAHNVFASVVFYNLGQLCLLIQNDEEATFCFNRSLYYSKNIPGKSTVTVVSILHNIGYIQYRNIELGKSLATFQECLQLLQNSSNKAEVAATLNCIGVLYFHLPKADTTSAMQNFNKALTIRKQIYGNENIHVATTLNNIGRVRYIKGEYDLALKNYLEALRLRRLLLGNDHLDIAATVYNAGQTFHQLGLSERALQCYREFLKITIPQVGREHRDVAIMLKCMAQIHHEQKAYDEALSLYNEALSVGRAALGMHAEVASVLNKIGNLHYECGDLDAALDTYKQGLEVERSVLDRLHPNISVTLTNIGQIYKQRGEYTSALKL